MTAQNEHVEDLLPWYVNGTLTEPERATVEAHLEGCGQCREELALLRAVAQHEREAELPAGPGELGLARLRRDVRRRSGPARPTWRTMAAVAAALVIAVESGLLVQYATEPAPITPLSGPEVEGTVVQVRFAADATEAEIRRALQAVDGTLTGGPGALGVYRVRLPEDTGGLERRMAALRGQQAVVQVSRE